MMNPCPLCKGKTTITTPDGAHYQVCPVCDGTGEHPGKEDFFVYPWKGSLTANQLLQNQRVVIGSSDFRLKMMTRTKTGDFRIRLFDSGGTYLSSGGEGGTTDRVRDTCIMGDGSLPFLMIPHPVIARGGTISFDLEDVSGAGNAIELAFIGAKLSYPQGN